MVRENKRGGMVYEVGYVSEGEEERMIDSGWYEEKVREGIERGLEDYFE